MRGMQAAVIETESKSVAGKKDKKKRQLHPKNRERAAKAAAAKAVEDPPSSDETTAEPVSGVVESGAIPEGPPVWEWKAYRSTDTFWKDTPFHVRYTSLYGSAMGQELMFKDKSQALETRDYLNQLDVMPSHGIHSIDAKEESHMKELEDPAVPLPLPFKVDR